MELVGMSAAPQVFRRRSLKYYIPLQCTALVMREVERHLPVHRRGLTHSVYLDTPSRQLYAQRLGQLENAKLFRFRWYGDGAPDTVWVELKVHKTRTQSTKTRFQLSAAQALLFAAGNDRWREGAVPYASMSAAVQQLADRCFAEVQARKLAPTVRTEYFRTSFEGEAGVDGGYRVTIDESVKFVADEELLAQQRWEAPLRCQGKTRKERALLGQQQQGQRVWQLPFCILEVKIEQPEDSGCVAAGADGPPRDMGSARSDERDVQPLISGSTSGGAGTQVTKGCTAGRVPDWVEPLLRHGALRPAVKFSKYLTGCAQLLPDSIDSIPSWMPELQYAASRALAVPGMESLAAGTDLGRGAALSHNGSSDPLAFCEPAGPDAATPAGGGKRLIDRSYRCEPKTFMANERTFLSWMRSLLPIGAVGLTLLRLGFLWDGLVLVLFAMTGTLYAAQRYEHRYQLCVNRVSSAELHHDRKAIPVMAAVFCLAMGVGAWVHGLQAGSLGVHAGLLGGQAKVTHKALRGAG